uniref:Uncharacterized protein n=1 Tax=Fusarium oxysporum (strain Fo5176) TaxID=660025 RepID=A0A0D2XNX8_FUSOF
MFEKAWRRSLTTQAPVHPSYQGTKIVLMRSRVRSCCANTARKARIS